MAQPTTSPPPRPSAGDEAWSRWGWLTGGIWLVFFGFPLYFTWTSGLPLRVRLATTAVVVAFCVVYVLTLRLCTGSVTHGQGARARRIGWAGLTALVLLALLLSGLIGLNSMTSMPFVVSLPVFFLPWRTTWVTSLALFAAGIAASYLAWGWSPAFLWGIAALVLTIAVLSRYLEERSEAGRAADAELQVVEERERVARDVHDVLGHSLTVVTMKAELAHRLVEVDPRRARQEMLEVQDLARTALAEIRATVGGLRVARLADEVESARVALAGAGITAELPEDLAVVDPRHRITLAWVLREAVTNVVRHSRAGVCRVSLTSDSLVVEDDGRGAGGRREGNGLRGLRERVAQAGGETEIGVGAHGRGTRLEVRL